MRLWRRSVWTAWKYKTQTDLKLLCKYELFKFESKMCCVLWVALLLYWRNDWTCRHLGTVSTEGEAGYSLMAPIIPTWGAKMASNNLSSSHVHFNPTDSWQPGDCSANVGETVRSPAADTIDLRWDLWNSDEQIKMSHEAVCCLCALHAQTEICAKLSKPISQRSNAEVSLTRQGVKADDAL